jgi:hypothetical protein
MEFHDCMKRVLPRVIEVEPTTENPHDLCFGRIGHLPNEPVLQFDFKIVRGTGDRVGEAFQRNIQMAWDSKATQIAIEHKLDRHKLRCMPRRNRPTENRKRPFATSLTRQNVLESVPLL